MVKVLVHHGVVTGNVEVSTACNCWHCSALDLRHPTPMAISHNDIFLRSVQEPPEKVTKIFLIRH